MELLEIVDDYYAELKKQMVWQLPLEGVGVGGKQTNKQITLVH